MLSGITGPVWPRRSDAPMLLVALCALLAGCVTASGPTRTAAFPPVPAPATAPPATQPPAPSVVTAAAQPAPPDAGQSVVTAAAEPAPLDSAERACADLGSGTASPAVRTIAVARTSAPSEKSAIADIPDPGAEGDQSKSKEARLAAVEPSAGSWVAPELGKRIAGRPMELTTTRAAESEAEKTALSGRTALAAELYAEDWKARPTNWQAAFKAIELWSRIGEYLRAEILLKAVEAKAPETQNTDVAQQARTLDDKLTVLVAATKEAQRLWRRTFVLEHERRYTEAVVLLHRLQDFEPTAPGYYIREASFFARCQDVPHAAAAIARGSAAGASYVGRWAPARDPTLIGLWSNPDFVAAIRDTLGEAGVEDFEERLTTQ